MTRILVTGASGQIGTELIEQLRITYGTDAVLATDIRPPITDSDGPFLRVDCRIRSELAEAISSHKPDLIYHLAAVLSATGEADPLRAYRVNMEGLINVLEASRETGCALFTPSSIAAFGPTTPQDPTPQDTIQRPTSMYGVTKVAGELLCDYYHTRFGVDTRGVRYPGIISYKTPPGGGTTDYAVEIFHEAIRNGRYTCFLAPETQLDMMYMPDAIRAAMELMEADPDRLEHRNAFNVTAMQLTPTGLAEAITRHISEFEIDYAIDPVRQAIAESWPQRLDDGAARAEWGWQPEYDEPTMVADMIEQLSASLLEPNAESH